MLDNRRNGLPSLLGVSPKAMATAPREGRDAGASPRHAVGLPRSFILTRQLPRQGLLTSLRRKPGHSPCPTSVLAPKPQTDTTGLWR